jgi:hypothetical protein
MRWWRLSAFQATRRRFRVLRSEVVLVGQRKALAIAIKGGRARRRWSKLREWLSCGSSGREFD